MKTRRAKQDLDQAIDVFRESVQQALEIGDVTFWNGKKLLIKETYILQAALVLAGECIALLLHLLATSKEAQEEARKQTESLRLPGSQGHGNRTIKVLTIGMVEVPLRVQYVVRRLSDSKRQVGQRGKSEGQGFYPLLKWLGIEEQVTPLVWSVTAKQSVLSNSFEISRQTLQLVGIHLSTKRIRRLTYCFGQIALNIRQEYLDQLQKGELKVGQTLANQRVVISVDGGRTRLRKTGRLNKKTRRRYYKGLGCEPKLLTIYVVNEQGKKIASSDTPITNDGTFGDVEAFMPLLEMHLLRLGIASAKQILLVADGASWIWERIPALLRRLGCSSQQVIGLLDFYHACGRLHDFAEAGFNKKDALIWFKKSRKVMKQGQACTLLKDMEQLCSIVDGQKKAACVPLGKNMKKALEYFTTRSNELAYSHVAGLNLPIGSGSIESLIRQVVNLRLKSINKSWMTQNAEILLHARCQWAAGNWDGFRDSVLTAYLPSS